MAGRESSDAQAIAERIRGEVQRLGITIRQLHERVRRQLPAETRGSSYDAIRAYCGGTIQNPRRNILQTIAEVLGVSPDWLILGRGARALPPLKLEATSELAQPAVEEWDREQALGLQRAVLQALLDIESGEAASYATTYWLAPIGEVVRRLTLTNGRDSRVVGDAIENDPENGERMLWAEAIGEALRAPLDAMHVNTLAMDEETLGQYITAMAPALFVIAQERGNQVERGFAP